MFFNNFYVYEIIYANKKCIIGMHLKTVYACGKILCLWHAKAREQTRPRIKPTPT